MSDVNLRPTSEEIHLPSNNRKLWVLDSRVLRRIFASEREEVTGGRRNVLRGDI
jgi:hypothetical protein